jgi:predicted anti-sigma-YlaC factor YlaD
VGINVRGKKAMGCDELRRLLSIYRKEPDIASGLIATHIRSCQICSHGIDRLAEKLLADEKDELTCEQYRMRFPSYYEATRPEYPLAEMSDEEMASIALHLGSCAACRDQYEAFVLLSELEERDEMADL